MRLQMYVFPTRSSSVSTHGQMRLTCNKVRFEAAFALAIRESESCLSCTTATLI